MNAGRPPQSAQEGKRYRTAPHLRAGANVAKPVWMMKNVGRLLHTIHLSQIQALPAPVTSRAGFELLCSYNWAAGSAPVIYVPGGPPKWNAPQLPVRLAKDAGSRYIDQNAARSPLYSFEPVFQAIAVTKPDYDFRDVDLVVNRNSLRKLLSFAKGKVGDSFRIDIQMVGNTLFVSRKEARNQETLSANQFAGYGHTFESAFTQPTAGLEDSTSHHRVINYAMGGLNCVVRFEVDASYGAEEEEGKEEEEEEEEQHDDEQAAAAAAAAPSAHQEQQTDALAAQLSQLSFASSSRAHHAGDQAASTNAPPVPVTTAAAAAVARGYQATRVVARGAATLSSRMAEIKTRSKSPNLQDLLPQLWFGRTPHLLVGVHRAGSFERICTVDAAAAFPEWEARNQDALRTMVALLAELRRAAVNAGEGGCVVLYDSKGQPSRLEVFATRTRNAVLPRDIVRRHWRREEEEGAT